MKTTVYFYNVSKRNLVDDHQISFEKTYGNFNIDIAKKKAVELFLKFGSKKSNGILIRIVKENDRNLTTNEWYCYYDGFKFKRKFNLYWDLKAEFEEFGISRYEKVTNLKDM